MTDLFGKKDMRLLSFKQPYGSMMIPSNHYRHKSVETRVRPTGYRGLILICTSLKPYTLKELINIAGGLDATTMTHNLELADEPTRELHGYAIAVGELIDCRPLKYEDLDDAWVAWNEELYAWIFQNVQRIEPFKIKGGLGLPRVSDDIRKKIKIVDVPKRKGSPARR